jgi:hypothetical protein
LLDADRGVLLFAILKFRLSTTHTFFCDETGHTGAQLHSAEQPMFADGGWIVSHEDRSMAMDLVANSEAASPLYQGTELKGGNLIKHPKGQTLLRHICASLAQFAIPAVYLVEKRFSICGKVVDTFFDPAFNPATPWEERNDPELMQSQAQAFYESRGSLVEEFAKAYQAYDSAGIRGNGEQWVEEFTRTDQRQLAGKIRASLPTIEDQMVREKAAIKEGRQPQGMDSLNLTIIHQIFQFVEQNCPFPCDIVHDQTATLEPIFRYIFDLYDKAPPLRFGMKDGRATVTGYRNIGSLGFANSEKQPLIRASDFSLAAIRAFVLLALAGKPIPADITLAAAPHLGAIWVTMFSSMYPSGGEPLPQLGGVLASGQWVSKVFNRFAAEFQKAARQ